MKSLQQTTQRRKYLSSIFKDQIVFTEKDFMSTTPSPVNGSSKKSKDISAD